MVWQTVDRSNQLDLWCQFELWNQVKELLIDDAFLLNVVDDNKSWFTQMEVVNPIYNYCFLTGNSVGRQPTASQFLQLLALQTLAPAATAIHNVLL